MSGLLAQPGCHDGGRHLYNIIIISLGKMSIIGLFLTTTIMNYTSRCWWKGGEQKLNIYIYLTTHTRTHARTRARARTHTHTRGQRQEHRDTLTKSPDTRGHKHTHTHIDNEKWVARGTVSLEFGWQTIAVAHWLELLTLD